MGNPRSCIRCSRRSSRRTVGANHRRIVRACSAVTWRLFIVASLGADETVAVRGCGIRSPLNRRRRRSALGTLLGRVPEVVPAREAQVEPNAPAVLADGAQTNARPGEGWDEGDED